MGADANIVRAMGASPQEVKFMEEWEASGGGEWYTCWSPGDQCMKIGISRQVDELKSEGKEFRSFREAVEYITISDVHDG